jgi:transposase
VTANNEALRAEPDQLRRSGKRQAAPFSKGTRAAEPKPPGRKPGSGTCRYREAPPPEASTEPPVPVQVSRDACPACGGDLVEERGDFAYRTERPELSRPQVTRSRVWGCRCMACGPQVRGPHPDLASDQYGATAHRLGPRVRAAAHTVHDGVGIPVRTGPAVLQVWTRVQGTPGARTPDALRQAQPLGGTASELLRAAGPAAPVVHTDDTGWRVGGAPASLMAVETDTAPGYQLRPRHRHEEVQEVIPSDDAGVMVTDRGRSYEAQAFDGVDQQKCAVHILRSSREVVATKPGRARDLGEQLKGLLQDARALWPEYRDGHVTADKAESATVQAALTYQLRDRCRKDPDQQRLLKALGWHHDRGNLRRCLADPRLEPMNNRAERALRPAVMARKVSHGTKSGRGADALAAFTRVMRTLITAGAGSVVDTLSKLFHPTPPQHVPT